jgi:hypothetical protein
MYTRKRTAGGCCALALILAIFVISRCSGIEDLYHPGHGDPVPDVTAVTDGDDGDDGEPTSEVAAQPEIDDTTVGITGTGFKTTGLALTDFTIGGAQYAKVTGISGAPAATAVTFATTALAAGDTFTIQANTSAFSPAAGAASNTVTFGLHPGYVVMRDTRRSISPC